MFFFRGSTGRSVVTAVATGIVRTNIVPVTAATFRLKRGSSIDVNPIYWKQFKTHFEIGIEILKKMNYVHRMCNFHIIRYNNFDWCQRHIWLVNDYSDASISVATARGNLSGLSLISISKLPEFIPLLLLPISRGIRKKLHQVTPVNI